MQVDKRLRVLHLEDNEADAGLIRNAFTEQGITVDLVRVENREDYVRALETEEFDLVLSDYAVERFEGLAALTLARERQPGVPFVYVSGTIGEERAVEAVQNGATDYVMKDRLVRLGSVVRRSMRDSALRTQKRLVEDQLHATFTRLQQVLQASPAVIYAAPYPPGALATFVSANVKAHFGYEPEEFTTRADFWLHRIHPDDRAEVLSRLRSVEASEPAGLQYRFLDSRGSYRWIEDRMNFVRDETGVPREVVGSWVDVTDFKRMQEEMRTVEGQFHQAQKLEAIGSLAGGVAHDFNNILMVILSYSSFVLSKLPAESPLRREIEEIHRAGHRGAELTHQLLTFSRKQVVSPQYLRPTEAIRSLSRMLARLIGDHISLSLDLGEDAGFIFCDPTQFDQVLVNLVVNARDAMPAGGTVTIQTRVPTAGGPPEIEISVRDTGVGIPAERLSRIFDPFFTTKPAGKGTGLGLSMVYGAVKQNGGRIAAESEAGTGTTMRIFFERFDHAPRRAARPAGREPASLEGLRVLVVEDNESVRGATALLLEGLGCAVTAVPGGEQALQVYESAIPPIDLVMADVLMPVMSGPELARRLRTRDPGVRILFTTGTTSEVELAERELGRGVPIIQKPFDEALLVQTVTRLFPDRRRS